MRIVFDGEKAFQDLKTLFQGAKKRIWVCMYMIRFDERTKELWRILDEKHEEGVEVMVWYDTFGCFRNLARLSRYTFTKAFLPRWGRLLTRNHAKVVLVDDKEAIVSGRNLTRHYFEEWVDTSTVITEPELIKDIKDFMKHIEQRNPKPLRDDSPFRITDPLEYQRTIYNHILEHIVLSQDEIMIASPYFVIDDAIEELLKAAMDRGVKVTVIIPKNPAHRIAATFNRINFQRIHHKNLRVMRSAKMFHSKVMLFDDVALIGSANFDNRSFKHSMELSIALDNTHARAIKKHLSEVADHSVKYKWYQRAYDNLLYHFTRHLMELL